MTEQPHPSDSPEAIQAAAADWIARRDRGLTPAEQDEYLDWLRHDPRHSRAIAKLDATWRRLDVLSEWKPEHATQPNPDLLAPPRHWWRRKARSMTVAVLVAAAVVVAVVLISRPRSESSRTTVAATTGVKVLPRPERLALSDGSVVELNAGSRIQTAFTPAERRVRLVAGEAHFAVAKNPARPFIVEAGTVSVRAVGTAFDVRRGGEAVEVLVTEGKVRLERAQTAANAAEPTPLIAGQRAIVDTTRPDAAPVISNLSQPEIEDSLAWQALRLEFSDVPLSDVVAEFNLRNTQQLVIGDADTGRLRLGGTFRADNIDGFVRLLNATLGVKAEARPDGTIVLRR